MRAERGKQRIWGREQPCATKENRARRATRGAECKTPKINVKGSYVLRSPQANPVTRCPFLPGCDSFARWPFQIKPVSIQFAAMTMMAIIGSSSPAPLRLISTTIGFQVPGHLCMFACLLSLSPSLSLSISLSLSLSLSLNVMLGRRGHSCQQDQTGRQ
jgi:hypothetical protein